MRHGNGVVTSFMERSSPFYANFVGQSAWGIFLVDRVVYENNIQRIENYSNHNFSARAGGRV